uniref:Uncharacterized protein n=1 Tax=Heterorhabditis bacteriophora TaxID=37862 RepID=A0A1I7W868_HETBA
MIIGFKLIIFKILTDLEINCYEFQVVQWNNANFYSSFNELSWNYVRDKCKKVKILRPYFKSSFFQFKIEPSATIYCLFFQHRGVRLDKTGKLFARLSLFGHPVSRFFSHGFIPMHTASFRSLLYSYNSRLLFIVKTSQYKSLQFKTTSTSPLVRTITNMHHLKRYKSKILSCQLDIFAFPPTNSQIFKQTEAVISQSFTIVTRRAIDSVPKLSSIRVCTSFPHLNLYIFLLFYFIFTKHQFWFKRSKMSKLARSTAPILIDTLPVCRPDLVSYMMFSGYHCKSYT